MAPILILLEVTFYPRVSVGLGETTFCGPYLMWVIKFPAFVQFSTIWLQPVLTVLCSEMLVDWLKHAFITKFNHIRPSVYERYTDVLCLDLASASAVNRKGARKVIKYLPLVKPQFIVDLALVCWPSPTRGPPAWICFVTPCSSGDPSGISVD